MPIQGYGIICVSGEPAPPADLVSVLRVTGFRLPDVPQLVVSIDLPPTGDTPFWRFSAGTDEAGQVWGKIERHPSTGSPSVIWAETLYGGDDLQGPYTVKATYHPGSSPTVRLVLSAVYDGEPVSLDSGNLSA